MIKLFPYIKKYSVPILISIVLLFVQAQAELTLPDYLSNIVTYGIQQSGIETAEPKVITEENYNTLSLLLKSDDAATFASLYTKVESGSSAYDTLKAQYSKMDGKPVYQLIQEKPVTTPEFKKSFERALTVSYFIQQAQANPQKAAQMGASAGFDGGQIRCGRA